jgi:hypothetical protein
LPSLNTYILFLESDLSVFDIRTENALSFYVLTEVLFFV